MSEEPSEWEHEYGLVMPFLPVRSKGGPFDDDAYVCGYEMGRLDALLQEREDSPWTMRGNPPTQTVHEENAEQADLIAMRHGFAADVSLPRDGWVQVVLTRPVT